MVRMTACSLAAAQSRGHGACRRLHDELKAAGDSPRLAALTARSVGKALQLMAEKAEYMAATGGVCAPGGSLRQSAGIPDFWAAASATGSM